MTRTPSIYIGIDLGTSGVRACAINHDKAILTLCKTPLPAPIKDGRSITQDANLWWQATEKVVTDLLSQINAHKVNAISVNGTSGTVLVCDAKGAPLAPARMYNDSFCSEQAMQIKSIAPSQSAAHGACSGLAKLLFLQTQFPQARHIVHQADWIVGKLCGHFDITDENNALKSGYDPRTPRSQVTGSQTTGWPDWLKQLNVNMKLMPQVVAPGTPIATICDGLFNQLNLNPHCQIVSGTTDSIAAFIATGASKPGDAVTSLGSTLVLKVISEQAVFAPQSGIYSHKLGDYWLAGGASNTGGAVLAHYFDQQEIDNLTNLLTPEKPTDLNYYPLLNAGERFPINDPDLPPRLEPAANTQLEFFQGILEGISQIELQGYSKLKQLGAAFPSQVETTGGGSKNKAWQQIRQSILGVPVRRAEFNEACYGSALLARQGMINTERQPTPVD